MEQSWNPCLQTLEGHNGWVGSIAFSPDGAWLASGSNDRTVKIWDAATGALQQTLEGHSGLVESIAFSHDGAQLASGSLDGTVKIWDAATGALQQTLEGHGSGVLSLSNSQLLTNSGIFRLIEMNFSATGYGVNEDKSWITWNGNNWLWLPAEYRKSKAAIRGSTIILGCRSGRVSIMNLA
jgi:WD40 repeat protein